MNLAPLCLLILLAACQTTPVIDAPPEGTAMIEVANGGSMFGSSSTRIYADGTTVQDSATAGGKPLHTVQKGAPDAYNAAAAVIMAEGKRTKAAMKPHPDICMDYGSDSVRADPPIAGFDQVSSSCPDDAVTALMDHVLASIAAK